MTQNIENAARVPWDYHHINHDVEKSDLIFVLCSHDLRVADYAASLFLKDLAAYILFSGGMAHHGDMLETGWEKSEAEMFADRAEAAGVPRDRMILECHAENTGENVLLSEIILKEKGIPHQNILAVQKPYMERRTYATIKLNRSVSSLMNLLLTPQFPTGRLPTAISSGPLLRTGTSPWKNHC